MNQTFPRRLTGLLASAAVTLAAAPAALAAEATVTGDNGAPVSLSSSPTLRNMKPQVAFTFAPDEKRYAAEVTGPQGPASPGTDCSRTSSPFPERVRYQGNGTYTVTLKVSKAEDDLECAQATTQTFTFTIKAFTAISPPKSSTLLTRQPGEFAAITYEVPVDLNPGADSHELRYAPGAVVGADGGLTGESEQAFADSDTGVAGVSFTKPGRYTLVARAKAFTSTGDVFTPWSPPVAVTVLAPFDLLTTSFPDSRGPSYKLSAQIRETTARGKVKVAIARGKRGKRFRRLGTAKIRRGGKFSLRFRLPRTGAYVLRYTYAGGPTVASGVVKEVIRITRR